MLWLPRKNVNTIGFGSLFDFFEATKQICIFYLSCEALSAANGPTDINLQNRQKYKSIPTLEAFTAGPSAVRYDDIYHFTIEKRLLFHIMFHRLFCSATNYTLYCNIVASSTGGRQKAALSYVNIFMTFKTKPDKFNDCDATSPV